MPGSALHFSPSAVRSLSLWFPLLLLLLPPPPALPEDPRAPAPVNPCCYYPCQHQGICVRFGLDRYQCDCTRTGYSGPNCTIPELWTWLRTSLRPSPSFFHFLLTHGRWFWEFVNATFIRDMLMRLVLTVRSNLIPSPPTYNTAHDYISWESFSNVSYYTRILPSVPQDCPTPMGTKGKKQLPDAELLSRRFLLRRKFIPDPQGANLMFAFFAQHFTHQFFKTSGKMGPGFTKALGHGVDLGHIYGDNLERQYHLRLFKDGKLKYQVLNGEMYPPSVEEAPVLMHYPRGVPPRSQMAMGQEVFGLLPGLMLYATLWLREHNRVCDLLKAEHPTWDDEQLFQTARLILIGETIKIVIEEYVQQLSGYFLQLKFDPELLFGVQFQYRNRIAVEFNQLYHWHPLMPNSFRVGPQDYSYEQFLFNTSMLMDYGVEALVDAFSRQIAGRVSLRGACGGQLGSGIRIPVSVKGGEGHPSRVVVILPSLLLLFFRLFSSSRCYGRCRACSGGHGHVVLGSLYFSLFTVERNSGPVTAHVVRALAMREALCWGFSDVIRFVRAGPEPQYREPTVLWGAREGLLVES
uniref:Prostaglandin G/H synthase 1 n=1 Tax=Sus scrofa TaxID=9823 RepID=A0A8D1T2J1_PIG